jgi:hypothetical protein
MKPSDAGFLLLIGLVYLLPTLVSSNRRRAAVFIMNLLLGWTGIGWVVALVMAAWPEDVPEQ